MSSTTNCTHTLVGATLHDEFARKGKAPRGTSLPALLKVPTACSKQSLAPDLRIADALVDESLREAKGCSTEAFEIGAPRLFLVRIPTPLVLSHTLVDISPKRVVANFQLRAPLRNAEDFNT